jgi:hypothetical protein
MSNQRQARTKKSASGPDHVASARDVAIYFREDCRTLRDSLQLEMVVAQYDIRMAEVETPQGIPVGDAVSAGVVAELERHRDPLSHVILRGLEYLGRGATAERSAEAAARLSEAGVELPGKFSDVGCARPVAAWREGEEDEYALFVDFEFPLGARHSLGMFVEPRHGGVVKHVGLMHPMSDLGPDDRFHPTAMDALELTDAAAILHKVLDRTYARTIDLEGDYRVLIAIARARLMQQAPAVLR